MKKLRNSRGLGGDHWAPRDWKALPPGAVKELGENLRHAEDLVAVPIQALINFMAMMLKPIGGERSVGLQTLWVVLRSSIRGVGAHTFDKAKAQFWDSAISGCSALKAGLMRRFVEELAVLSGQDSLSAFWDVHKFYDSIDISILIGMMVNCGFSITIAAMDLMIHVGLRILKWCRSCSSPITPCTSILVGSKFSNTNARIYLYKFLDDLHNFSPTIRIGSHVDDIATMAVGFYHDILDTMKEVGEFFARRLKGIKLTISPKTVITSSKPKLAKELCDSLDLSSIKASTARSTRDLGLDCAAGKRRAAGITKQRIGKAGRRLKKLKVLSKFSFKSKRLYATNLWPSSNYATAAMGMAPSSINLLRRHAGAAALGKGGQCSTTAIALAFTKLSDPAIKIRIDIE